jgi:site-specific DNA-methyltransferase (adenine-specific)
MINFYNTDNIRFMKTKADMFYDLAIVDPPYGIGLVKTENGNWGIRTENKGNIDKETMWDFERPTQEYFDELFRVSKNQIIWGGNYFIDLIKKQTSCFIIWDKINGDSYFADAEIAWTSFETATRIFKKRTVSKNRIHICQKPVDLYRYCLQNYADKGQKILDTHGGSHTHAIACEIEGFDLDIIEISEKHHNEGKQAYNDFIKQKRLF